ncbi:DUF4136 domain-containing protein [Gelatiniphilus marinus]|uniref:DUF4136 domain-containing protein n=1 Tax=Gelatiniphilus marinus TaxID=1759464 RepID=A0ABW5JRI6_9FLAO
MKFLKLITLILLINACAPIRVNYDFDTSTNFSKYKTYNYYADMKTGLSDLDTKRFLDAFDAKMQAKGFSLAEKPDFFIDIKSSEFKAAQRNTVGVGLGGGGRNVGGGLSVGIPIGQSGVNRKITIDFVDENGKGLFWQAVSESSYNPNASPENRTARLNAILDKVLVNYPPKE